jgi:hypothetical protein
VRGTKLKAWRVPPVWKQLQTGGTAASDKSKVLQRQRQLLTATQATLNAVYADVRRGLLETVGVDCALVTDELCSVVLELPAGTDTEIVARAIDLENVEAWRDAQGRVNVAINPWYSTKDVDQTVLSAVKVIHVLLGIHATDNPKTPNLKQTLLSSVAEILSIQKSVERKK